MLLTVASIVLAVTFLASGGSKVLQGRTRTLTEFRRVLDDAPEWLVSCLALVLGPAELLLGVALAFRVWPALFATLSAVALAMFTLVLVRIVRSGRRVACNCFGAAQRGPVTWASVGRNLTLLALACAVALAPVSAAPDLSSSDYAALAIAVALIWMSVSLVRVAQDVRRAMARVQVVIG